MFSMRSGGASWSGESAIPEDWRSYLVPQDYGRYGRTEHQVWRDMLDHMETLVTDLEQWIHPEYVRGFRQLILPWSSIPMLEDIDEKLAPLGWRTVSVDGYIPAEIYAGLMSRGIFPVSRNLRRPEHIDFSPSPDLAHDLFGHVPMLVSEEHRNFLKRLAGEMARASSHRLDRDLYEANRTMAALRSDANADSEELTRAEGRVSAVQDELSRNPSELTHLARMYLWSIEFGLMGTADDFRMYGAGLLSSPTESQLVAGRRASIVPYSLDVIHHDIRFSDPQSRYFVASGYGELHEELTRYSWRTGRPLKSRSEGKAHAG